MSGTSLKKEALQEQNESSIVNIRLSPKSVKRESRVQPVHSILLILSNSFLSLLPLFFARNIAIEVSSFCMLFLFSCFFTFLSKE